MSKNSLIIGAVVIVILFVVWFMWSGAPEADQGESTSLLAPALLVLEEQNDSGVTGTVAFGEENGVTRVVVALEDAPEGVIEPMHIHDGSCAELGAVRYPLTSASNGSSETALNVPLQDIMDALPLAVNVHKSAEDASTYVACGDITSDLLRGVEEMIVDDAVVE